MYNGGGHHFLQPAPTLEIFHNFFVVSLSVGYESCGMAKVWYTFNFLESLSMIVYLKFLNGFLFF